MYVIQHTFTVYYLSAVDAVERWLKFLATKTNSELQVRPLNVKFRHAH